MAKRLCALVLLVLCMQDLGARAGRFSQEAYEKGISSSVKKESEEKKTVIKGSKNLSKMDKAVIAVKAKREKKHSEKNVTPAKIKKEKVKKEKFQKKSNLKKDSEDKEKLKETDKITAQAKLPVHEQKVKVYGEKKSDVKSRIKNKEKEHTQARKDVAKEFKHKPKADKKELFAARLAARDALTPQGEGVSASEEYVRKAEILTGARNEHVDALKQEVQDLKAEYRSIDAGQKKARKEFNKLCDKAGVKCADKASDPIIAAHDQVIKELTSQKKSVSAKHEKKELAEKIDAHKQARAQHVKNSKKTSDKEKAEKRAQKIEEKAKAKAEKKALAKKPVSVKEPKVKAIKKEKKEKSVNVKKEKVEKKPKAKVVKKEKKEKPAKVKKEKAKKAVVKAEKKKSIKKAKAVKPVVIKEPKKVRAGRVRKEATVTDNGNDEVQRDNVSEHSSDMTDKYNRPERALRSK